MTVTYLQVSNPSALYYEKVTNFNLPTTLINREADARILSGIQDAKAEDLLKNYNVYPTFALNKEIDVSPTENFKDVSSNRESDIKQIKDKLFSSRISKLLNLSLNYGLSVTYKNDDKDIENKKDKINKECDIIGNIYSNKKLLDDFRIINFRSIEKFQEGNDLVEPNDLYQNNMLVLDGIIMNNDGNGNKSFNSKMSNYLYPNQNNNTQYNEVKITQYTYKSEPGKIFASEPTEMPLEFNTLTESYKMNSGSKFDLSFLIRSDFNNSITNGKLENLKQPLRIINAGVKNYLNYEFNDEPQEELFSNNFIFKAKYGQDGGVYNKLVRPNEEESINNTSGDEEIPIPDKFKLFVHNNTALFNRGKKSKIHCDFLSFGMWIILGIVLAIATVLTAGTSSRISTSFSSASNDWNSRIKCTGVGVAWSTTALTIMAANISNIRLITIPTQLELQKQLSNKNIGFDAVSEFTSHLKDIEGKIKSELSKNIKVVNLILYSCTLNSKTTSNTTENLFNVKCLDNIEGDGNALKISKNPYYLARINGQSGFTEPNNMGISECKNRPDLLTIRKFVDINERNLDTIRPYGMKDGSYSIQIGKNISDKPEHIQHGSPNYKHIESFTYMSPEVNKDKFHSYIDLSDGGISLNDYGGLNYFEIYKNYIKDGKDNIKTGIINYSDANSTNSHILLNQTGYDKGNLNPLQIDGTTSGDNIGTNHIHGRVQFVPERPIFYEEMIEPYKVKSKSYCLDLLYDNLIYNGVNQLLITRQKNSVYTKNEELDLVSESIITDIGKYLKSKREHSGNTNSNSKNNNAPQSEEDEIANFNDVPKIPTSINSSINSVSQNNSCININRFPVNDPYYKYNNCKLNKFQDTNTDNYTEDTLGVLNTSNELNVDVNLEDRILRSGNTLQDRNVPKLNILDGEPIDEFQDIPSEETQEPEFVMKYEETFITNHQNLVDKFGDNSVIMEGEYYYVKIPVVYQGADFKVNGHKFYMVAELHEYPLETYQYPISESNYMNDENSYQSLYNSRLGTSIYLLNKWDKNNGFLRNGDILTFVIRIDKNVVKGQEKNRNSIDCKVGGVKQFSKECRITLSDYNFLVVYLKNYDFDFNIKKLGEIESFVYKNYPIDLHPNETQHLVNLTSNNRMVSKRYIGRKIINGIVLNQESFLGLRQPNIPSLINDVIYGSINESEDRHQLYFCNDDNNLR